MGGKDDDRRSDIEKFLEAQRAEILKWERELFGRQDDLNKNRGDDRSPSIRGPFERFKNFVDSNFSTLSSGFKNFPANVSELKARMQAEREARQQEELDISRRWVGCDDSPDHIWMQVQRQTPAERDAVEDATYMLLREAYERNKHVPAKKILGLYQDQEWNFGSLDQFATPMLSFGGACYYKPETVENLPSTARWGWPAPKQQWLSVDWFKRDPYSPVRLEARPETSGAGTKWRAAFEDLLSAALDKPLDSKEKVGTRIPYGNPQSTYHGPGLDWMLSLQCRGILPPQLPSLYKPVSLFDGFDEVKRPRRAEFMHDMDKITSDKSARMYPLVRRDLNALMDEIAVQSGPPLLTVKTSSHIPQSPWRVPETEAELYEDLEDEQSDEHEYKDRHYQHADEEPQAWCPFTPEERSSLLRAIAEQEEKETNTQRRTEMNEVPKRPDVLSQLTTTQTTRQPDGTVTTKVVLKQRFADGREETHESVHTTREDPKQPDEKPSKKALNEKKGWFWS